MLKEELLRHEEGSGIRTGVICPVNIPGDPYPDELIYENGTVIVSENQGIIKYVMKNQGDMKYLSPNKGVKNFC